MDSANDRLMVYRDLADTYDRLGQVSMRDRFLILSADAALEAGQPAEAERQRQRLLQTSRYHMLRPYNSFAEAAQAADVQSYLRDLRANYPLDIARQLLETLQPGGVVQVSSDNSMSQHMAFAMPVLPAHPEPPTILPMDTMPPMAEPVTPDIPQTAPLIDIHGRPASRGRPTWQPANPGVPVQTYDLQEPNPPPAPTLPLSQPIPRISVPLAPASQPTRTALPSVVDSMAETKTLPPGNPPTQPREPSPGSWLAFTLGGLVLTAALALAAFTLARPFLSGVWQF